MSDDFIYDIQSFRFHYQALGKNGECCSILKLEASSTGNSSFIQQKFMGLYFRYPQIRLNEYQAFSHEGYDGALMMDKRPDGKLRGWRV